jgi:sec-independent protein translocase protein TatA
MFGLGVPEIIIILVVFLMFFGKDKLPELARSVGRSFNELKAGFSGETKTAEEEDKNKKKS